MVGRTTPELQGRVGRTLSDTTPLTQYHTAQDGKQHGTVGNHTAVRLDREQHDEVQRGTV